MVCHHLAKFADHMYYQGINQKFWEDDAFEAFGKISQDKGLCTHHKERKTGGSGFFVEGVFLKRSLCMLLLRPFPCAKTTYNLI